ncbi:MAG: hypothetical protein AAFV29_03265, partial [Myxococcota bacterium]
MRTCTDETGELNAERCNGLDDDCDGTTDGPSCSPIIRCLDDAPCGAFVCTAPQEASETICAPANPSASVADFDACARNEQCRNGLCESGICAPTCRSSDRDACRPAIGADGREVDTFCAQSIGPGNRPPHNLCQKVCARSGAACSSE